MSEAVAQRRRPLDPHDCAGTGLGEARWQYVGVSAEILPSGFVAPREVLWPDGRRFAVERVVRCLYMDAAEAWYYEVRIAGTVKQLWYRHGAFFVLAPTGLPHGAEPPTPDRYELRKRYGYRA